MFAQQSCNSVHVYNILRVCVNILRSYSARTISQASLQIANSPVENSIPARFLSKFYVCVYFTLKVRKATDFGA